jgi:hypothetical protein
MSIVDDLEARAQQSLDTGVTSVQDWIDSNASEAVIKLGDKALGNQTAAEIAAGQTGGQKLSSQGTGNPTALNARPYPTLPIVGALSPIVLVALGVGIYFLMKKKG